MAKGSESDGVPGRSHCMSIPDADGILECLWCGMVAQEAVADSQTAARKALGAE